MSTDTLAPSPTPSQPLTHDLAPRTAPDDEPATADDRFDRGIASTVVAALAVAGTVGSFSWPSTGSGISRSAGAATTAITGNGGGGTGSNGDAAVANPAAVTTTASPTPANPAASRAGAAGPAALDNADAVSASSGTTASIGAWAITATPGVNALRANASTLNGIIASQVAMPRANARPHAQLLPDTPPEPHRLEAPSPPRPATAAHPEP